MRTSIKAGFFIVVNIVILTFLVRSVWQLLGLLVIDGANDAILLADLPALNSDLTQESQQVIPKIIHQTYKNASIPDKWLEAQHSCMTLHDDYEYILWTDEKSRDFISAQYPWFLETFDAYPFPIQRADAIRYFVLNHYGGIYIDLDDGCQRRLDPLLAYPAWVRRTKPTGISNDVMGAVPGHPFFAEVIESLDLYNRDWLSPYVTIMASTGPLFLSLIWRNYNLVTRTESERVRILFPDSYMSHSWSFFTHHVGNSWHQGDAKFLFWMSTHWVQIPVLGFVVGGFVIAALWFVYNTMMAPSSSKQQDLTRRHILSFPPVWMRRTRREHIEMADRYEV